MDLTRWWKCDFQVATPNSKDFKFPRKKNYHLDKQENRSIFCDDYCDHFLSKDIEVIAVADHNTHEWIDDMMSAGKRRGLYVFPGCEITTASGHDGIHLVIVGDPEVYSGKEFDELISSVLGYGRKRPRLYNGNPSHSEFTATKILDELPNDVIAFAPHIFNQNGAASGTTIKGGLRYEVLSHPRLMAVDVGVQNESDESYSKRFRERNSCYASIKKIAFLETSDTYSFDKVGNRFSWLRMSKPSFEGFRQSLLDHESRIIRGAEPRLNDFPQGNPNKITRPWISSLKLTALGNSNEDIIVPFHPGLNVVIGGRGSGKSTIVSALKHLYSKSELPCKIKDEFTNFSEQVFKASTLHSSHKLPQTQMLEEVIWIDGRGSKTKSDEKLFDTDFKARIVLQKELYERTSQVDRNNPFIVSESIISLLDEEIGLTTVFDQNGKTWQSRFDFYKHELIEALRIQLKLDCERANIDQLSKKVRDKSEELSAYEGFPKEERDRLLAFKRAFQHEGNWTSAMQTQIERIKDVIQDFRLDEFNGDGEIGNQMLSHHASLMRVYNKISEEMLSLVVNAQAEFNAKHQDFLSSSVGESCAILQKKETEYIEELREKGLSEKGFLQTRNELEVSEKALDALIQAQKESNTVSERVDRLEKLYDNTLNERFDFRKELVGQVQKKVSNIRFNLKPFSNICSWERSFRKLINLKNNVYMEDVKKVSKFLFCGDAAAENQSLWKEFLFTGYTKRMTDALKVNAGFLRKIANCDLQVRSEILLLRPDDIIELLFLKQKSNPDDPFSWQDIKSSSPGQRSAGMLSFILNYGEEPLVLDQPEDDLDTAIISDLIVENLRSMKWRRQVIVVTHNANIPVNGDADNVIVLENKDDTLQIKRSLKPHVGAIEDREIRHDIQDIMEGGVRAFLSRERRYKPEVKQIDSIL